MWLGCCALILPVLIVPRLGAHESDNTAATESMERFLARESPEHGYRALRRLEAENRGRTGWLEAWTTLDPGESFRYEIVAEGGSPYIRSRVLRGLLEGEKEAIEQGERARSALVTTNYRFESEQIDPTGLVRIALLPRRKDGMLVTGAMFLTPGGGELVKIEGRLAKNPVVLGEAGRYRPQVHAGRRGGPSGVARDPRAGTPARACHVADDVRLRGNRRPDGRHSIGPGP